jgi:YebC/PmpR family DNA-binding regulatory protein
MAGHSKWANIQHRKKGQDAKRGKLFTKLIREIMVAAKMGDADPINNPRLRAAIDKGLSNNMTRDTVDRAVKRGAGDTDSGSVDELRYEGYGPAGVAVLVDTMTDNKNRTVAEVRHAFSKSGGSLATEGAVAYLFAHQGTISFAPGVDEDQLMELAIEAGADDVQAHDDGSQDVVTNFEDFGAIKDTLDAAGLESVHAEVTMEAAIKIEITNLDDAEKVMRLIDKLEDLDDVQEVYSNVEFSAEVLAELDN